MHRDILGQRLSRGSDRRHLETKEGMWKNTVEAD